MTIRHRTHGPRRRMLMGALSVLAVIGLAACADSTDTAGAGNNGSDAPATSATDIDSLLGEPDAATGDPVKVGMITDGATEAFDNTEELTAARAAAEYWNEYKGGLAGHRVEVVTCETKADPSGAIDCANQMISDGVVAVAMGQSAVAESAWKPLQQAGVPFMIMAAHGEELLADGESTFTLADVTGTLFTVPVAAARDNDIDKAAFVIIDVPQALTAFESVAPQLLGDAGIDYEVVKVPIGTADMTPQMQQVANSGAGLVHVIGNDAFCIAAFQGLQAVAFDGTITSVSQCVTDATREAVDGSVLEGMLLSATTAVGDESDEGYQRYLAVMETFAEGEANLEDSITMGGYVVMASLLSSLSGAEEGLTPASAIEAIRAMDEVEIPGGGGVMFRCDGTAVPETPAVCTNQVLTAELDADGNPASYTVSDPAV